MSRMFVRPTCAICGDPVGRGTRLCDACQGEVAITGGQAGNLPPASERRRKKPRMGDVSIFCPSCNRPNYPDEEQCWRCGAPLGRFVPPRQLGDEGTRTISPPASGSLPGARYLSLTGLSDEEVVSRFRRAWLLEVLLGPASVVVILAFYLARDHWVGFLSRIPGTSVVWGLIGLSLVVGALVYRCPRCHRSFFMRRMGHLRSCPRCGAGFELPEQQTIGVSTQRLRRWINDADHRRAISWLAPVISLVIVVGTPSILSASQDSTVLPLASPAVIATVAQSTSQPLQMTKYVDEINGFSFRYPASWEPGASTASSTNSKLIEKVSRLDPSGAQSGDFYYTDLVRLYVFHLSQPIDSASYNHTERTFEHDWLKIYRDVKLVEPWKQVSLGGLSGIEFTAVVSYQGQSLVKTDAFLFDGTREFQLEAQSTLASWPREKVVFDAFFQSFQVTNAAGV